MENKESKNEYTSFVLEVIDEEQKLFISEEEYEKIKSTLVDLQFDHKQWKVILYNEDNMFFDKRTIFGLGVYKQNFLSLINKLAKIKTILV